MSTSCPPLMVSCPVVPRENCSYSYGDNYEYRYRYRYHGGYTYNCLYIACPIPPPMYGPMVTLTIVISVVITVAVTVMGAGMIAFMMRPCAPAPMYWTRNHQGGTRGGHATLCSCANVTAANAPPLRQYGWIYIIWLGSGLGLGLEVGVGVE